MKHFLTCLIIPSLRENAIEPVSISVRLRTNTTAIRSISVVSACFALRNFLSFPTTIEVKLLKRSPIELNMTRPKGIPNDAYKIVNVRPPNVFGVEWP